MQELVDHAIFFAVVETLHILRSKGGFAVTRAVTFSS